jgi:hypothetical protein
MANFSPFCVQYSLGMRSLGRLAELEHMMVHEVWIADACLTFRRYLICFDWPLLLDALEWLTRITFWCLFLVLKLLSCCWRLQAMDKQLQQYEHPRAKSDRIRRLWNRCGLWCSKLIPCANDDVHPITAISDCRNLTRHFFWLFSQIALNLIKNRTYCYKESSKRLSRSLNTKRVSTSRREQPWWTHRRLKNWSETWKSCDAKSQSLRKTNSSSIPRSQR